MEVGQQNELSGLRRQAGRLEEQLANDKHEYERRVEREESIEHDLAQGLEEISVFANETQDRQTLEALSNISLAGMQDKNYYLQAITDQQADKQKKLKRQLEDVTEQIFTIKKEKW